MAGEPAGAVVLPCGDDMSAALAFFTQRLAFKVRLIFPADAPEVAVLRGQGLTLRLDRDYHGPPPLLQLCPPPGDNVADVSLPEGVRVEWLRGENLDDDELEEPNVPDIAKSFVLTRKRDSDWSEGRAGMQYRDLVPDRQGGRFICSHIRIPAGGEVPDYVHHHRVRFQMIFCCRGWADLVYEDQGPPFRLREGDCVLQPPRIRHRVLRCSPGLEVVEVSCPGKHNTYGDPDTSLPTAVCRPERLFSGQRFARHQAERAHWQSVQPQCCSGSGSDSDSGWQESNTGLDQATGGLAGVRVLRACPGSESPPAPGEGPTATGSKLDLRSSPEFAFRFVLRGSVCLSVRHSLPKEERGAVGKSDDTIEHLCEGDAFVVPDSSSAVLTEPSPGTQILEVSLPAFNYKE